MRKFTITATLCVMFGLLAVGQAFALDCATGAGWGDYLTQEATKGSDGYYEIDTPEKLAWISCKMKHNNGNFKTAKVKLTQSIDMQGNLGKVFIPIAAGTGVPPSFDGTFDGQGFTISNLYINTAEINNDSVSAFTGKSKNGNMAYAQNIGLFGIISGGGTVRNLTLKDVQIYASASAGSTGINDDKPISVGTVVGWVSNGGKIENCVASGSIETSGKTSRVGGIAGNVKSVTISNCVSSVSVTASGAGTNVGGIVGALRNGGSVSVTSCVYSGNSLYTVDGSVGAIAGSYESVGSIKTEDLYYSDDFCENLDENESCSGIGTLPEGKTFNTDSTDNLNSEDVVCNLNGGTWQGDSCAGAKSEVWSVGQSDVSMNGSDGYKITFNANGGTFASGAKTTKILAKNVVITADEIGVPTREGKKFAGWATTANAEEPTNLGVAHAAISVYAVWYDFYEVTFKTGCDTAFSDAKFPDSTQTKTVSVAKHGTISVDGFSVPTVYEIGTDENKVKYYFTGWAYAPKSFDVNDTIAENDTLRLSAIDVTAPVTLYAVWTKAPTFSVTFDASLHGTTDVHFVRMVTEGETVSRPDTVITDDGYKVVGWCVVEECSAENEYTFTDSLKGNLVLHARWEMESYSIDYELDGGTNAAGNPSAYNIKSGDIVFAAPTKEGATFDGWFYDSEFTNPATQIGAGSTGDKKIYAKWTNAVYVVQYLSGNTIYATAKNDTKLYGDTIQLKGALEEFVHRGCTQDGWSKVDYGQEGYGVDYALGADYAANENLKVFPHWTCNTYRITYEMYGMSATNRNDSLYTGPAKITLENAFDPAKKYYFMDSWYKDAAFKTAVRDIQNIDADLTLYAKWYNKITYKPGSKVSGAKNLEEKKYFDTTYTLKSSIDKYVRANYTLDGWSTTDGGEKVYELGETYTTNENLTLYPHWVENREVVLQSGAVTIYKYATDNRKEAVINGNYGGGDEPNLDEADAVEISSDITVNSVTLNRTFNAGKIATLFVPFEIDAEHVVGTEVYKFKTVVKSDEDNRWKFKVATATKVLPNTPYVIIPEGTQVTFDIPTSVTLNTTTVGEATAANNWEFVGAYQYEKFTLDNNKPVYLFADQARDGAKLGEFVKIADGAYINPMRAYLVYHKTLAKSARGNLGSNILLPDELDIEIENENGIVVQTGTLNTVTGEVRMDRWFDLKGRKLNSKPTVKGTYYKNGKRVIVK